MTAYYNENDPYCAEWLRNLIAAGCIAKGDVDERSIEDVSGTDTESYEQCHFFAGIGIWSHALRAAGWSDRRRIWTGSCPCQPFSEAGKGTGLDDERHLWPAWLHLITERKPEIVLGEQVASKNALAWLDVVQADLEGLAYACGAVVTPACGFSAPHIRQRLYWVAYADEKGRGPNYTTWNHRNREAARWQKSAGDAWERLHAEDWKAYADTICKIDNGNTSGVAPYNAYANALVAPQATEFIKAAMEYAP